MKTHLGAVSTFWWIFPAFLKGEHGMHVHENPTCAPAAGKDGKIGAALSAGGHYDPAKSGKHAGSEKAGHLGDLPL